jgi:hypothetical protein
MPEAISSQDGSGAAFRDVGGVFMDTKQVRLFYIRKNLFEEGVSKRKYFCEINGNTSVLNHRLQPYLILLPYSISRMLRF